MNNNEMMHKMRKNENLIASECWWIDNGNARSSSFRLETIDWQSEEEEKDYVNKKKELFKHFLLMNNSSSNYSRAHYDTQNMLNVVTHLIAMHFIPRSSITTRGQTRDHFWWKKFAFDLKSYHIIERI